MRFALLAALAAGCSPALAIPLVDARSPAIEIILHGDRADLAKSLAEAANGAHDTDACNLNEIIVYFSAAAFRDEGLRRHEFCHVQQYRRPGEGRDYGAHYAAETKARGYDGNKYEIECRAIQDDPKAPTADSDK